MDAAERAFLQSIAEEDDDATPLVYADWLSEAVGTRLHFGF